MKLKTRTEEKPKDDLKTCVHYWIVGHPKYGYSKAICKYCGERKVFESSFADSRWYGEMPEDFKEPMDVNSYEQGVGGELF